MSKFTYNSQIFSKEDALVLLNAADNKTSSKDSKILNKAFTIILKNTKMLKEDAVQAIVNVFQNNSSVTISNRGRFIIEYSLLDDTKNSVIDLAVNILKIKKEKQIAKLNKELSLLK